MKTTILLCFIFYIFVMLQVGFLPHFSLFGVVPNVVLLGVLLISALEKIQMHNGLVAAFSGGFFLDVFSQSPLGFWVAVLLITSLAIKILKQKYVRVPVS